MEDMKPLSNHIKQSGNMVHFSFETISSCPRCKSAISPRFMSGSVCKDKQKQTYATILNYCEACQQPFITTYTNVYEVSAGAYMCRSDHWTLSEPISYKSVGFDALLESAFPRFVKIYNQSVQAETLGLDEIAGIGYRKSLEILVKDFAILEHFDESEEILSLPLVSCIKKYIDDSRIQTLTEKSAWLGNDEGHYLRKHEDRSIEDMKRFIRAATNFIASGLAVNDALDIMPK